MNLSVPLSIMFLNMLEVEKFTINLIRGAMNNTFQKITMAMCIVEMRNIAYKCSSATSY